MSVCDGGRVIGRTLSLGDRSCRLRASSIRSMARGSDLLAAGSLRPRGLCALCVAHLGLMISEVVAEL